MKKIYCIPFIFVFCLICTGCFFLWCDSGSEPQLRYGTSEILLTPQKEKYNLNDEITLSIKYSSTKNVHNKILLKSYAEIYDYSIGKYIYTDNIILNNENSEENLINENYILSNYDEVPEQEIKIEENLLLRAKQTGHYRISVFLLGCKNNSEFAKYDSKFFYIEFQ